MGKIRSRLKPMPLVQRHRFAVFFFLFLAVYHVVMVNQFKPWRVDPYSYAFHCVDFSFGFATKLLPGAVFRALFGAHASETAASVYETVLLLLFFAGVSVLLEKFLRCVSAEYRRAAMFLLLFFVCGACTFSMFSKHLGALDVYWAFFNLLFVFFLESKRLRFLVPLLFFASVLIHYSAVLNTVILFSVLLLYYASVAGQKNEKRSWLLLFAVSVCATAALVLFFLLNESRLMCPMDTFHEKLTQNGSHYFIYYDYAFYHYFDNQYILPLAVQNEPNVVLRILETVYYRMVFNFDLIGSTGGDAFFVFFCDLALLSPLLALIYRFHAGRFRKETNRFKRFCTLLMMAQFPFTLISGLLFSADINRWMTHAFLIFFTCFLIVLYREEKARNQLLERIGSLSGSLASGLYFVMYAAIVFPSYLQIT